jgi:3-hydroxybutyryl-CoA dehydrogenase
MKICVVGAGTMGRGIAQALLGGGQEVLLCDTQLALAEAGKEAVTAAFRKKVQKAACTEEEAAAILGRLSVAAGLGGAAGAELVIEAASENPAIKLAVFKELDATCAPGCILASNTSSISISAIAAATKRPESVVGMHFFNPVHAMKLVEVIRGARTSDATFRTVAELAASIGKEAVEVSEAPGFVVNRILVPMINEAVAVLAEGVASAADIDRAMALGANHPMGPLALGDLIGLDVVLAIMEVLHGELGGKYLPHPLLRKMVRAGKLGRKSGEGFFPYPPAA